MKTKTQHIIATYLKIFTAVLFLPLLVSCKKSEGEREPFVNRVVLIYLNENRDLLSETHKQIEAIRQSWQSGAEDRLIIYTTSSDNAPTLYELSPGNGGNIERLLLEYHNENTITSKEAFSRVLTDVKGLYNPASLGLILFSRTSGWLPKQTSDNSEPAVMVSSDAIGLNELAAAIPDSTFEFIIFEAPYMAGIEAVYELKDKAAYILASPTEIVSPSIPSVYSEAISYLFEKTPNLESFADKVFDYLSSSSAHGYSATISITNTSKLPQLAAWLESNVMWGRVFDIDEIQHFDMGTDHLFFDFEDYYNRLLLTEEQRQTLSAIASRCVIYKKATPSIMIGHDRLELTKYSGFTSYIPQDKHSSLNNEFKKLAWSKAVGFDKH